MTPAKRAFRWTDAEAVEVLRAIAWRIDELPEQIAMLGDAPEEAGVLRRHLDVLTTIRGRDFV